MTKERGPLVIRPIHAEREKILGQKIRDVMAATDIFNKRIGAIRVLLMNHAFHTFGVYQEPQLVQYLLHIKHEDRLLGNVNVMGLEMKVEDPTQRNSYMPAIFVRPGEKCITVGVVDPLEERGTPPKELIGIKHALWRHSEKIEGIDHLAQLIANELQYKVHRMCYVWESNYHHDYVPADHVYEYEPTILSMVKKMQQDIFDSLLLAASATIGLLPFSKKDILVDADDEHGDM
jgi:hypothetical protein